MGKRLVIESGSTILRIPLESLVYVKAEGNYSRIFTVMDVVKGGGGTLVVCQLGQIQDYLAYVIGEDEAGMIVRAVKSHIINLDFVYEINLTKQTMTLSDCERFEVTLSDGLSRQVLKGLKDALGQENNDND